MKTISLTSILCTLLIWGSACAAEPAPTDVLPEDPAIKQPKEATPSNTVKTTQEGGQTQVKVTNRVGTYVVKPKQGVGTSLPGDAQSSSNRAAQWVVESWGDKKAATPATPPDTLQPNPNSARPDAPTKITQ